MPRNPLPATLSESHAEIRRLRRLLDASRRLRRDLEADLERAGDYAYRLLDDREFLAEQLDVARSCGSTRLGFYGRIADPVTVGPEDVP